MKSRLVCATLALAVGACGGRTELLVPEYDSITPDAGPDVMTPPPLLPQIAVGGDFTCGIRDGTAKCWGFNYGGRLGDGTDVNRTIPTPVVGLSGVVEIAPGESHVCARLVDGSLSCWGNNHYGEVGDGTGCAPMSACPDDFRLTPIKVLDRVLSVHPRGFGGHSCARRTDGTVACWGKNDHGQLCEGTAAFYHFTPTNSAGLQGSIDIRGGNLHTCARWPDGTVRCCGWNKFGQLGNNATDDETSPVQVQGLADIMQISAGHVHNCALRNDQTIACWGYNVKGQLGDGTTTDHHTPITVPGISNAVGVSAGTYHSCAWLADGTARCWGQNQHGELGDGTTKDRLQPTPVVGLTDVVEIACDLFHTCARRSDGEMLCWGRNELGEIGDGTTEQRLVPTPVAW